MRNKILLTGASGFLGNILRAKFAGLSFDVTSLGTKESNDIVCDLGEEIPFLSDNYDIIIHAAGKAHSVPRTLKEEKEFYDVNCQGTVNLCNAIDQLKNKPKAFIFISTVAVYGLDKGVEIAENRPLQGSTPYAKSKIQAENYLQKWTNEKGITVGILRLPLIAGPNPPGNLGALIKGIKSGRYLSIANASASKSMVWADDIAKVIPKLAEIGGVYNLTDGCHPSFSELEKEVSKCLGKKAPVAIPLWIAKILARVGDIIGSRAPINTDKLNKITNTLTFDDLKARMYLGWCPSKVVENLCKIDEKE